MIQPIVFTPGMDVNTLASAINDALRQIEGVSPIVFTPDTNIDVLSTSINNILRQIDGIRVVFTPSMGIEAFVTALNDIFRRISIGKPQPIEEPQPIEKSQTRRATSVSNEAYNTSFTGVAWSDTDYLKDDNYDNYARSKIGGSVSKPNNAWSRMLKNKGYSFDIPIDATVTGIKVEVDRSDSWAVGPYTSRNARDYVIKVQKNDSTRSADKLGSNWTNTKTTVTYGADNDLWGMTWTPAEINSSDFGFLLAANGPATFSNTLMVYDIRLTVYYDNI